MAEAKEYNHEDTAYGRNANKVHLQEAAIDSIKAPFGSSGRSQFNLTILFRRSCSDSPTRCHFMHQVSYSEPPRSACMITSMFKAGRLSIKSRAENLELEACPVFEQTKERALNLPAFLCNQIECCNTAHFDFECLLL